MDDKILKLLPLVSKPSRYVGCEVNSCVKDLSPVKLRVALCFPDAYEVGVSHLGLKILYEALNARPDVYAERAYCPWPDMEARLRENALPLATLETGTPLSDMDVVGFTLQYELSYTNVLAMLSLGGIPLRREDRGDGHPLVIAGGPCAFNPEPMSDFIDAFVIGDAEEAVLEIAEKAVTFSLAKRESNQRETGNLKSKGKRVRLLEELAKIEGVYVPAHFEIEYGGGGGITKIKNIKGGPEKIRKRTVADIDAAPYPARPIVPYMAAVHNRVTVEVARGCTRGCRFCQAGYIYRPARERAPGTVTALAESSVRATGYEEVSLSSLSAGDYSCLLPLMTGLMDRFERSRVSISLPSLRVGTLTPEMCRQIRRVRKTGFTIAPEAGTQRLRDVINKGVTEEALMETADTVFREGWDLIKLYFMVGLPTETDADIEGIIRLSRKVLDAGQRAGGRRKTVNVGVSAFVPKPHTPFQWQGQIPLSEILRKKEALKKALGRKPFAMKAGLAEMSVLEAAFARGGRRLGAALVNAFNEGARFDGWTEMFDYGLWGRAFEKAGLDLEAQARRAYGLEDALPWDHIDTGVTKKFLKKELERSLKGEATPDCRVKCTGCGLKCGLRDGALAPEQTVTPAPLPDAEGKNGDAPRPSREMVSGGPGPAAPVRVRLTYAKLTPLALLSHSELMNLFFRAISRARLPILFSEGFNPHPRVSFGPALAVGIESEAETLDMELSYALDLKVIKDALNAALPSAVRVLEAHALKKGDPAAGAGKTKFTYEANGPEGAAADLAGLVEALLASGSAVITRVSDKGERELDIRPMVGAVEVIAGGRVRFTLVEHEGKSARPFEFAQALFGLGPAKAKTVSIKKVCME